MKIRKLLRSDLPIENYRGRSLHIPVIYNNEKRFVADIHKNDTLCYLEDGNGEPFFINDLSIIEKEGLIQLKLSDLISYKRIKIKKLEDKIEQLEYDISELEKLLN